MDIDWIKFGSFLLGTAGTLLGGYNLIVARQERQQKIKHNFALLLLSLDPILDRVLALPFKSPDDLRSVNLVELAGQIADIDAMVDEVKKDLVVHIPEVAGRILNLRRTSSSLRTKLCDPNSTPSDIVPDFAKYLYDAWGLTIFRSYAKGYEFHLSDQGNPSSTNWMGDEKVGRLVAQWERFFHATQLLERSDGRATDALYFPRTVNQSKV